MPELCKFIFLCVNLRIVLQFAFYSEFSHLFCHFSHLWITHSVSTHETNYITQADSILCVLSVLSHLSWATLIIPLPSFPGDIIIPFSMSSSCFFLTWYFLDQSPHEHRLMLLFFCWFCIIFFFVSLSFTLKVILTSNLFMLVLKCFLSSHFSLCTLLLCDLKCVLKCVLYFVAWEKCPRNIHGLNLTRGIFLEDRHLSQLHSAYTSAWMNWNAASVRPLHVLQETHHTNNMLL